MAANKEIHQQILTNVELASSEIKRLLLHLETLFLAVEEQKRGEYRFIRDELEWLFEDQGTPGASDPRPSILDEASIKLQPVERLLDEVGEDLLDVPLPDAGRAIAPCNAHSQAWNLGFQIKLKFLEMRSNATQILDFMRTLSSEMVQTAIRSADPDLVMRQADFPWRLRDCESTPVMLMAAFFLCRGGGVGRVAEWDVFRGSFLKFIEDLGTLDFGTLRMRINKESALARRFVTEERISEISLELAATSPNFLGLIVEASDRRVCKGGCEPVRFERHLKAWELFFALYSAGPTGASLDYLMECLWPSKPVQPNNLDQQKWKLNTIIECLGIEVTFDNRGVWRLSPIA